MHALAMRSLCPWQQLLLIAARYFSEEKINECLITIDSVGLPKFTALWHSVRIFLPALFNQKSRLPA